jgi:hypothetical protein
MFGPQPNRSFFAGGVPIGVPPAAFEFEGTLGHDLGGFLMALGAIDLLGVHPYKAFGDGSVGAFEFIDRHGASLSNGLL